MRRKNRFFTRLAMGVGGVVLNGICVGVLLYIRMGTDPYNVLADGLSRLLGLRYDLAFIALTCVLLLAAFALDRHALGVTTVANLFLVGVVGQWVHSGLLLLGPAASPVANGVMMAASLVLLCLAASLYMTADLGVSGYDALGLYAARHTPIPFRYLRMGTDSLCVLIGFLGGADVGIATVATALCMGPAIEFFSRTVSRPLLQRQRRRVAA